MKKKIKVPYGRQFIDQRDIKIVKKSLSEEFITTGKNVQSFENSIKAKFSNLDLGFVRGDHSNESTLKLANLKEANSVIVISDDSIPEDDDKTILTTLTVKNLFPNLKVVAYVTERKKIPYLKRANADEVITDENFKSFLTINNDSAYPANTSLVGIHCSWGRYGSKFIVNGFNVKDIPASTGNPSTVNVWLSPPFKNTLNPSDESNSPIWSTLNDGT